MQTSPDTSPTISPVAERAIATLDWGFRVAAVLLGIGVILSLARQDPLASTLPELGSILGDVRDLKGNGFIGLAIFAIVITPVITTLTVSISFFRTGDRRYGMLTLIVLAILGFSIIWSQR